jgi:preprotein translocase subunit SecD
VFYNGCCHPIFSEVPASLFYTAIEQGYKSAFSTIFDANITTMITGIIWYTIGNGPVKGFALILCLGILTNRFMGVFVSKVLTNMVIRKNKTQLLGVNV